MDDCQNEELPVSFDGRLQLTFLGSQVTTDAGLRAYRELAEVAVTRNLFAAILDCIARLAKPPPVVGRIRV